MSISLVAVDFRPPCVLSVVMSVLAIQDQESRVLSTRSPDGTPIEMFRWDCLEGFSKMLVLRLCSRFPKTLNLKI